VELGGGYKYFNKRAQSARVVRGADGDTNRELSLREVKYTSGLCTAQEHL
jgi:hypothetical protein